MSRLLYLVKSSTKSSNILSKLAVNNSLKINTPFRYLTSKSEQVEKKIDSLNELDKPQWERSDRFV